MKNWLLVAALALLAACSTTPRAPSDDVLLISGCTAPEPVPEEDGEGCARKAQASISTPLSISGTPAASVVAGTAYSFKPGYTSSRTVSFSISNKPVWANFSIANGALSGTPSTAQAGAYPGIGISVTDGVSIAALPVFTITVTAPPNTPPAISGTPTPSVVAGTAYQFKPTATDANGDPLTFAIAGLPAWATFNTGTGVLSGTPGGSATGTYSNIVISVSDGKASTALAPFSITVTGVTLGSASLSWSPPTQNTDGSSLVNLAGYNIYYGTGPAALNAKVNVANPGATAFTVTGLASGTWYFALTAYSADGVESALSNVSTKVVP